MITKTDIKFVADVDAVLAQIKTLASKIYKTTVGFNEHKRDVLVKNEQVNVSVATGDDGLHADLVIKHSAYSAQSSRHPKYPLNKTPISISGKKCVVGTLKSILTKLEEFSGTTVILENSELDNIIARAMHGEKSFVEFGCATNAANIARLANYVEQLEKKVVIKDDVNLAEIKE